MGKTSTASHNKYISKAYDRINLTVAKGDKDKIKAHAVQTGESVNAFIQRAIKQTMLDDATIPGFMHAPDSSGDDTSD